jgi:hypothetical protein
MSGEPRWKTHHGKESAMKLQMIDTKVDAALGRIQLIVRRLAATPNAIWVINSRTVIELTMLRIAAWRWISEFRRYPTAAGSSAHRFVR